jgi:hypothetical protein
MFVSIGTTCTKIKGEIRTILTKHFSSQPCQAFFRLLRSMTTTILPKLTLTH